MRFDINNYTANDYRMTFQSLEEVEAFCQYLDSIGRVRSTDRRYVEDNYAINKWQSYGSYLCIYFNEGTYDTIQYEDRKSRPTLRFSDFEWGHEYDHSDVTLSEILGI